MTTELLTVSPAVVRARSQTPPADQRLRSRRPQPDVRPQPDRPTPPPGEPSKQGDWRYETSRKPNYYAVFVCLLVSAAAHAAFLFAFNEPAVVAAPTAEVAELEITFMEMPPIEEPLEPDQGFEDDGSQEELDPGAYVPMQADAPSFNTEAVFQQKLDLASLLPRPDFDSAKVVSIPPKISRNGIRPSKMKDLFNLADLDRQPLPLLQRPPDFPYELRNLVNYAEVVVDFIVDKDGRVPWAQARSSTHSGFEDAAVVGVSRWQFKPGSKAGRPVNTRMRVPIRFRVGD
jgi:TonB family protein